jgi:hypothetical protein
LAAFEGVGNGSSAGMLQEDSRNGSGLVLAMVELFSRRRSGDKEEREAEDRTDHSKTARARTSRIFHRQGPHPAK